MLLLTGIVAQVSVAARGLQGHNYNFCLFYLYLLRALPGYSIAVCRLPLQKISAYFSVKFSPFFLSLSFSTYLIPFLHHSNSTFPK